jgi:succinate-semialdehyde dehydrogenase/glutarate-semialdehyde dehydrogenase
VTTGGSRHELGGRFFQPTVVADWDGDELFQVEETFGPLVPIFAFDTEDEVVARANASEFGLASYLFTENLKRAIRVSRRIEAGMVGLNTGLMSNAANPFGGVKQSGYGREGSKYGMDEYLQIKSVTLAGTAL